MKKMIPEMLSLYGYNTFSKPTGFNLEWGIIQFDHLNNLAGGIHAK